MKKYQWISAITVMLALIIFISCKTRFDTTKTAYKATSSAQAFEHGKNLVYTICAGCHYNRATNKFTGNPIEDVPGIAGKVYSANLTHSKTRGATARYSDAEIKYLLRTGVARDGRFLAYMLRPNMADEDINDIIVYLRSDDPPLAADDRIAGTTHFTLIGKIYEGMSAKPVSFKDGIIRPPDNDPVALGYYLVDNVGCFHCHSKNVAAINSEYPNQTKGYLAGGFKLKGPQGTKVTASNITPDKQTGIGNYSKEQFRKALKDGEAPGRKLHPPMPKFQKLSDNEVDAIYAYLQTVPPEYHKIKDN
jgi:mono/diheme cytochrome c family protein